MSEPIHIHVVDITRSPFLAAELTSLLSRDERQRAERLRVADKRSQFIACRAVLRQLLGAHCGQDPATLRFAVNEHGKPALTEGDWQFNLSHSLRRMVLACSTERPLGVDVEYIDPSSDVESLARRYFAVDEYRAVMLHREEDVRRAFFCCWSAKEAYLKLLGGGIDRPLDSFVIGQLQHLGADPRPVHAPDGSVPAWVHRLDAGRDYMACLACDEEQPELVVSHHELAQLMGEPQP